MTDTATVAALFTVLVILVPIIELVVFAVVAEAIGVLPAILLLVAVSALGAVLLVREGIGTWRRLRETIRRRERPTDQLLDAALIASAGALFLTPGFFTDALAFLVVVPPTRRTLRNVLRRFVTTVAVARFGWRGKAAAVSKKVYEVRATSRTRPGSGPPPSPEQLPSSHGRDDADDSPDTG